MAPALCQIMSVEPARMLMGRPDIDYISGLNGPPSEAKMLHIITIGWRAQASR